MSRLRILVTTPDFPPAVGGIQRLIGELVANADSWETRVVTLDHPDAGAGRAPPVHRIALPGPRQASVARLNWATIGEGLAWRPDAVICGHVVASPGALLLGRRLRVPTVQYVYAMEIASRPALARFAMARSTATIAISEHTARIALTAGADPARLHVIPPGVVVVDGSPPAAAQDATPTILTVARLADRYKGFDVMLRAMPLVQARIPRVRWVVVGDGPLRGELERTAQAWSLAGSVLFRGHVSSEELDAWYARSDVFAMPSRLPADGGGEGYGLVYLEAAARGLPCVGGDRGAAAEAVVDGETGLLVDATDHVATAGALIELLDNPDRAAALGAAGRERARALSWSRMAASVEALVAGLRAARP